VLYFALCQKQRHICRVLDLLVSSTMTHLLSFRVFKCGRFNDSQLVKFLENFRVSSKASL
jgi:hypothetical protein